MENNLNGDIIFLQELGMSVEIINEVLTIESTNPILSLFKIPAETNREYLKKVLADIEDLPVNSSFKKLSIIKKLQKVLEKELKEELEQDAIREILCCPVDVIFSNRPIHALKTAEVDYMFQLVQFTEEELLKFTNIGKGAIKVIVEKLSSYKVSLGMTFPDEEIDYFETKTDTKKEKPFSFEIEQETSEIPLRSEIPWHFAFGTYWNEVPKYAGYVPENEWQSVKDEFYVSLKHSNERPKFLTLQKGGEKLPVYVYGFKVFGDGRASVALCKVLATDELIAIAW